MIDHNNIILRDLKFEFCRDNSHLKNSFYKDDLELN